MSLHTRECFCCIGANYFACLNNAHSHVKTWPALPELAGRFYSGPGSVFCSPQQPVGKDFAQTCRSSLSGLMARSFLGTPSKMSPWRLPHLQNVHLYALPQKCLAGQRFPLGFPLRLHLKHQWPVDRGICRHHRYSFYLAWNSIEHLGSGEKEVDEELRNVFISSPVIKPLCSLGFVSSRQNPISKVRRGCFDFASFRM